MTLGKRIAVVAGISAASLTLALPAGAGPSHHPLRAWCAVHLGESRPAVVKALGRPHGTKAKAAAKSFGLPSSAWAEWDVSGDVLLATFEGPGGTASNLQAYAGQVGPFPAHNLACKAFRNSAGS